MVAQDTGIHCAVSHFLGLRNLRAERFPETEKLKQVLLFCTI